MQKNIRRLIAGVSALLAPALALAQGPTGEIRLQGMAAWAPRAGDAHPFPDGFGPPPGRVLPGALLSLSFTSGGFSAGPEGLVLRGSDRRMYGLGGVGRFGARRGRIRPNVLVGFGYHWWERKQATDFEPVPFWTGDNSYWTVSAGVGAEARVSRRLDFVAELRGWKTLGPDRESGSRNIWSLDAGVRVTW